MINNQKYTHNFIYDAVRKYSENVKFIDFDNPTKFNLNNRLYSTHISIIHDSGANRGNDDEVRIQLSRQLIEKQKLNSNEGYQVAFIGLFKGGDTFITWDPRHIFSLKADTNVSVYGRQSQLINVEIQHASVFEFKSKNLQEPSFAIALPSHAFGFYLENIESFHQQSSESDIINILRNFEPPIFEDKLGKSGDFVYPDGSRRKKFTFERKVYPRDPRFSKRVLNAYNHSCCICQIQLGLVQASHIIPHSESDSPNTIQNGLCLCVKHHTLYDSRLLLPGPNQELYFNEVRAEYLKEMNSSQGLEEVRKQSEKKYLLPSNKEDQPSNEYLQRGLDIRLGS